MGLMSKQSSDTRVVLLQVVTFDCTVQGTSQDSRHTYVNKCVGSDSRMKASTTAAI